MATESRSRVKPAAARRPAARGGSGRGEARAGTSAPRGRRIKVRAIALGYYNDERKRIGDVFTIGDARFESGPHKGELREYSSVWMELADANTREKKTGPQEALNRETHRVAREKAGADPTGPDEDAAGDNVLGD